MLATLAASASLATQSWHPGQAPLMTRWAADVRPDACHPEYPRPQMARKRWLNLNGLWEYAVVSDPRSSFPDPDGHILVPFPIESALSGVMKPLAPKDTLWYRRTFKVPTGWRKGSVLLHFGAVDYQTAVWVNGHKVGEHTGGYDPFSFEIGSLLKAGDNTVVVEVTDPTDTEFQPRGKQVLHPEGILYTPTSGIWQTVWLEPVPTRHLERVDVVPDIDKGGIQVTLHGNLAGGAKLTVLASGRAVAETNLDGKSGWVGIGEARLWSPEKPYLYTLKVESGDDVVTVPFGMRKISLGKDEKGVTRLFLNNQPVFMFGPLDQGFWPDGLYTAPTEEAMIFDLKETKRLGFNMVRKHVKVEPATWYAACDKLGLLVWQDMPSGWFDEKQPRDTAPSEGVAREFRSELTRMIDALKPFPSIVVWVPFNEGWGQHDTAATTDYVRKLDPSRLVDSASGWHDHQTGDLSDIHHYPEPKAPENEDKRAATLGEFGGLGLVLHDHVWIPKTSWGYQTFKSGKEIDDVLAKYFKDLEGLKAAGLSAAVYTQTTDVEQEVNGLLTYDRAIVKIDAGAFAKAAKKLTKKAKA